MTGADAAQLAIASNTCSSRSGGTSNGSLVASATCDVTIEFDPASTASKSAMLEVTDDAPGSPHAVSLAGLGTEAAFSMAPKSRAFGDRVLAQGRSANQAFTISNTGDGIMTISSFTLSGSNASEFVLVGDDCSNFAGGTGDNTIAPTQSCAVTVAFGPSTIGVKSASITIGSDAASAPHAFTLNGTGVTSGASLGAIDSFGSQRIDAGASALKAIVLTNSGTSALTVSSVTLTGTHAADFVTESQNCTTGAVAVGASCTAMVRFDPSAVGARSASLTFMHDAPGGTSSVALFGTGESAPVLDVTAPVTRIIKRPTANTRSRRAVFTFGSSEPGSTFSCKLDGAAFKPCKQTFVVIVAKGRHSLRVVAVDQAGNRDVTPARATWNVTR